MRRERLLGRIGAARVAALVAGAGAGKTVLADQAIGDAPAIRLRVGPDDDLAAARAMLGSSARRGGIEVGEGSSFDAVLGAIARHPDDLVLVLDDVHRAGADVVAELVAAALDLPARHRLLLAGRDRAWTAAVPPGAVVLDDRDLAFDDAEVAEALGRIPGDLLVQEVAAATGGWAAGVVAVVERIAADARWSPVADGAGRALLGGVVADLALPAAALLAVRFPLLDAEVLAALGDGAVAIVDLPATRLGRWRSVLPAVAAAVDPGADVVLPDDVVVDVARHYLRSGEAAAAVRLVGREGSGAAASRFLRDVPWTVLADLDVELVATAVDRAAGPVEAQALVLLAAARAAELTDNVRRGRWIDDAEALGVGGATGRAIAAERARFTIRRGDVAGGSAAAEAVLADTPEAELVTRARALTVRGIAETYACTAAAFVAGALLYREAANLFARAGEVRWQADTLARLGYTNLYLAGRPVEGADAMEQALAMLPVGDLTRAFWRTHQADVLDFVGRDADAEAALREAIEIGTRRGDPAAVGTAWWSRSWLAAHRGDAAGTRAALEEVERNMGAWLGAGQQIEYLATSAEHLLLAGDVDGYHAYMVRCEAIADASHREEAIPIIRACFDCTHGDAAAGLAAFQALEGKPAVVRIYRPRRLLHMAVAALRMGDPARAAELAAAARADAAELGVPDLHERQHRPLLEQLAPLYGTSGSGAPSPDAGPRLRLQLLGGFSLAVGAEVRTPPAGHPATLVKLLALGGPLASEAAIDALWPEADATTGRARLRNVLNRLKERSGPVVLREGDVLRMAPEVEVDVGAFEAAAAAALAAEPDLRIGRARHALALHTGELLPGDRYDDWSTGPRARVQRRVLALADLVAADAEDRGELDEAARLLDLGMELEPLDERRAIRLAGILARQGHRAAATAVARRCADLLDELGVAPSPELTLHL